MAPVNRPTSPHLTIYKPQITSVLSIMHRMTGVALYAGALLMVSWLYVATYMPNDFAVYHGYLTSTVGQIFLFGWTLAFYFHLANGIRHLFWDMGKGYDIKTAAKSGWLVVAFALLATAGSCYLVMY